MRFPKIANDTPTLPDVVALLNTESPPTIDQLTALLQEDTEDAGVYSNLIILISSGNHSYLYIGGGSSVLGEVFGLDRRRIGHESAAKNLTA